MIQVPEEFRLHQIKNYPPDNDLGFEEWFYKNYDRSKEKDIEYLPIFWTSYYCNNNHGKNKRAMRRLDQYIEYYISRGKKLFTVVQYDDGILNNVSELDLKVFGMGCKGDVQLPLVCQPHKYEFKENGRPIFASFIGAETHPIRTEMIKQLEGKDGYFISTERTSLHTYCYIMSQSKYCLAPLGYGKTSFRISEGLQFGAVPIYIGSEFLFNEGCINFDINMNKIEYLPDFLFGVDTQSQPGWPEDSKKIYYQSYTYEAVANMIYENI